MGGQVSSRDGERVDVLPEGPARSSRTFSLARWMRTQTQLNTWSTVALLPLIVPAFVSQVPLPAWAGAIVFLLPTAQTMRLGMNALAGRQLYGAEWLSVAIILGWAVVFYGLVWWRQSREEAA